jgi:hypothetical protein
MSGIKRYPAPTGGASVTVSDTPPLEPEIGDLWYESDTGKTFVYYDSYWVEPVASTGPQGETGETGPIGPAGPLGGLFYTFSSTTTDADPGSGFFRFNNNVIASTTQLFFDLVDGNGVTQTGFLDSWDDSSSSVEGTLVIQERGASGAVSTWNITGVTTATGYRKVSVTYLSGSAPVDDTPCVIQFARTGDVGATGATGPAFPTTISASAPSGGSDGDIWLVIY